MLNSSFRDLLDRATPLLKALVSTQPRSPRIGVGIDVGTTSIKCVALGGAVHNSKSRPLLGTFEIPTPSSEEDLPQVLKQAVQNLNLPIKAVNLGISGQSVIMRVIEMPMMEKRELKQALPFEAQRYLPFPLKEVVLDGQILGASAAKKNWVLIVACRKDYIQKYVERIKQAGLDVALVDIDALAMANSFFSQQSIEDQEAFALVNIGAKISSVVICKGQIPYLVRDVPWGAERLIRETAQQAGQSVEAFGTALRSGSLSTEALRALAAVAEALVIELQLSFDYFENQFGHPPEKVFVSGGIVQSGHVLEALSKHLNQPVAVWSPLEKLGPAFAVAHGLASRVAYD